MFRFLIYERASVSGGNAYQRKVRLSNTRLGKLPCNVYGLIAR